MLERKTYAFHMRMVLDGCLYTSPRQVRSDQWSRLKLWLLGRSTSSTSSNIVSYFDTKNHESTLSCLDSLRPKYEKMPCPSQRSSVTCGLMDWRSDRWNVISMLVRTITSSLVAHILVFPCKQILLVCPKPVDFPDFPAKTVYVRIAFRFR